MELGTFSVSLAVKDLSVSQAFYEKLGFEQFAGDASQGWLIMKMPQLRDRPVSRHVRKEHFDLQSRLGR